MPSKQSDQRNLSQIEIAPGGIVLVRPLDGDPAWILQSTVLAASPGALLLDYPQDGSIAVHRGDRVELHILTDGKRYSAGATIVALHERSLSVEHEALLARADRRALFRLSVGIEPDSAYATDEVGSEIRELDATIIDLSGGGAQLIVQQPVAAGDLLHLSFSLGAVGMVAVEAVAVTALPQNQRRTRYRVGVKFVELPARDEELIIRFIHTEQVSRLKGSLRSG